MATGFSLGAQPKIYFDVPPGKAGNTLKQAAEQAGIDLVFSTNAVKNVTSRPLKGKFSIASAFSTLLEGTGLRLYEDPQSNTYAIVESSGSSATEQSGSGQTGPTNMINHPTSPMQDERKSSAALSKISRTIFAVFMAGGALSLQAQETEDEGEISELSPFVVETREDTGYIATSTLAGGRLRTRLEDTPSAIQALTIDFLEDIAAVDQRQATRYALNAIHVNDTGGDQIFNDYAIEFRGLGTSIQARNYFQWYINSDNYNVERLEFARGPNSVVFGDSGVGGLSNINTKRANEVQSISGTAAYNSWNGGRATIDWNQPLAENLAIRINGMIDHSDGWRDQHSWEREGIFLTSTWKPFSKTEIRLEYENGSNSQFLGSYLRDSISEWDGITTISAPMSGNLDAVRRRNSDYLVWTPTEPDQGIVNWLNWGGTRAAGGEPTGLRDTRIFQSSRYPILPDQAFNLQAPNREVEMTFDTTTLFLEQQFGDNLFLELAYNHTNNTRDIQRIFWDNLAMDVNEFMPDGVTPNPNFLKRYADANPYEDRQSNVNDHFRASAAYRLKTKTMSHDFLLAYQHRTGDFNQLEWRHARTNGPNPNWDNSRNRIRIRRYEDQLGEDFTFGATDPISGYEVKRFLRRDRGNTQTLASYQAAVSSSWFSGRLTSLVGYRYDDLEIVSFSDVRDDTTREVIGRTDEVLDLEDDQSTITLGAVYDITNWLSLVANYGESFLPRSGSRVDINGNAVTALSSEGYDFGLRFKLLEGKLYVSASYYQNEEMNNDTGGSSGNINGNWEIMETVLNANVSDLFVPDGYRELFSKEGFGWEFELVGNITQNWRILLNISLPDTEQTGGFDATDAYVATHLGTWQNAISELNNMGFVDEASDMENNIQALNERSENFANGRPLNGRFDYLANLYTQYNFDSGSLKGLFVGAGVNFRGDRLFNNRPGDSFDFLFVDSYSIANFTLGYRSTLWGHDVGVQLNVDNVFEEDQVQFSNGSRIRTVTVENETLEVPQNIWFLNPRQIRITTDIRF